MVPTKPLYPPTDMLFPFKTRSMLGIAIKAIILDGGAPILNYNIYIDNGLDQDNFKKFVSDTSLTFSTSSLSSS